MSSPQVLNLQPPGQMQPVELSTGQEIWQLRTIVINIVTPIYCQIPSPIQTLPSTAMLPSLPCLVGTTPLPFSPTTPGP